MLIDMNITAAHGASPRSRKRNERSCRKGFLYVDDILVCGTTEKQRGVFELFHKFSVYQYVDMRKQCAERFGIANLAGLSLTDFKRYTARSPIAYYPAQRTRLERRFCLKARNSCWRNGFTSDVLALITKSNSRTALKRRHT